MAQQTTFPPHETLSRHWGEKRHVPVRPKPRPNEEMPPDPAGAPYFERNLGVNSSTLNKRWCKLTTFLPNTSRGIYFFVPYPIRSIGHASTDAKLSSERSHNAKTNIAHIIGYITFCICSFGCLPTHTTSLPPRITPLRHEQFRHRGCDGHFAQ